jgi:hypothetical protein
MTATTYSRLAGTIFGLVALAHAVRLFTAAPLVIGATTVPMAASWVGLVVTGALCIAGWRAGR